MKSIAELTLTHPLQKCCDECRSDEDNAISSRFFTWFTEEVMAEDRTNDGI